MHEEQRKSWRDRPTGTNVGVRVSKIDMGRSLTADKMINDDTDSFKPKTSNNNGGVREFGSARDERIP